MATQAQMLARAAQYPLDVTTLNLAVVLEKGAEYYYVTGNIKLPSQDGTPATLIPVEFNDIKTD